MSNKPKIAISACFLHPDEKRAAFGKKTLQYVEQSMSHWVMASGALPVMVPPVTGDTARGPITLADYAQWLDGLIMHGGVDVWPGSYGETPLRPEWSGDKIRDDYEIALVKAFVAAGKPVFGICRGLQLINVAYGGTLYQDISTQRPAALQHRDGDRYEHLFHQLKLVPESKLASLLAGSESYKINSIHHQGIKDLAPGFLAEAHCAEDGVIEAIRHTGPAYITAVQWHPEFHVHATEVLDDGPLMREFLQAAGASRASAAVCATA